MNSLRRVTRSITASVRTEVRTSPLEFARVRARLPMFAPAPKAPRDPAIFADFLLCPANHLSALLVNDNPNAYIFPNAATHKRANSLSNQFREIMADAGLVEPRRHEKAKQGRSQAREPSELSFHSLRHSAVTMLKAAGVSDFIAREIVGHESAAVSRQYTHLSTDDKRTAMQRLPDVTSH